MLAVTNEDIMYFVLLLVLVVVALLLSFGFGWWMSRRRVGYSPFTGNALRSGSDLHWMTQEKVLRFLYDHHEYDNRMFDLQNAAICRDTGRIFQDCVTWYDTISLDWTFLQKRYPGKWVSWGSLTDEQRLLIREKHDTIEGFQTEHSSKNPNPRKVEKEFIYQKPGPLVVDIETSVLLGWKIVPGTELEVLIVQKPPVPYVPSVDTVEAAFKKRKKKKD